MQLAMWQAWEQRRRAYSQKEPHALLRLRSSPICGEVNNLRNTAEPALATSSLAATASVRSTLISSRVRSRPGHLRSRQLLSRMRNTTSAPADGRGGSAHEQHQGTLGRRLPDEAAASGKLVARHAEAVARTYPFP